MDAAAASAVRAAATAAAAAARVDPKEALIDEVRRGGEGRVYVHMRAAVAPHVPRRAMLPLLSMPCHSRAMACQRCSTA